MSAPTRVVPDREGPTVTVSRRCDGCRWLVSTYYTAQGDSGFDRACTHGGGKRDVGFSSRTPDWCPVAPREADEWTPDGLHRPTLRDAIRRVEHDAGRAYFAAPPELRVRGEERLRTLQRVADGLRRLLGEDRS